MSARLSHPDLALGASAAVADVAASVVSAPTGLAVLKLAFLFEGGGCPPPLVSGGVYVVQMGRRVSPDGRQAQEAAA